MNLGTIVGAALVAGLLATPAFAKDQPETKARITKTAADQWVDTLRETLNKAKIWDFSVC